MTRENLFVPESRSSFCDLAIAGSDYGERQYRSAFHYEVLRVGTPRGDVLFRVTIKLIHEKMKSIGINKKYKYLFYAPTLRCANQDTDVKQNIQGSNICEILSSLETKYGGEWKCLLRAHLGVREMSVIECLRSLCIN